MSTEENKATIRRFYEELFSSHNVSDFDKYLAPGAVDHAVLPGLPSNAQGSKQSLAIYFAAFPDVQAKVEDVIGEGDKVVARVTFTGTNTGSFLGMPATGKRATISGIDIERFEGGKFAEHWQQLDMMGLLQQLGLIPAPGQAGS